MSMSRTSVVVVDGLFRALCPSIDAILCSSYRTASQSQPRRRRQQRLRLASRPAGLSQHTQCHDGFHSLHQLCQVRHTHGSAAPAQPDPLVNPTTQIPPEANTSPTFPQTPTRAAKLYETLRELRKQTGKGDVIRKHVKSIVNTPGEKANIFLYEALAAANWDTSGSAEEVALILEASRDSDIPPSSNLYHDALRVLAIHPDYSLRAAILEEMAEHKIPLTTEGNISVTLGYLRDGQHEMALDYLDKLIAQNAESVPTWIWDIFIYNLASQGFADEAFRLLQDRLKLTTATNSPTTTTISPVIWSFLLDECSRALHYEATKFIWNRLVSPQNLNPSDGTTLNVLNTAARHRDPVLATQAIQHLSTKGIKLGLQHYEPLLDCYAHTGDLENALRVLCIMNDAGLQTDPSSTRSLYTTLRQSPPDDFLDPQEGEGPVGILRTLAKTHGDIPTSAMNVLIEALPPPPHAEELASAWITAVEIYQQLRGLCRTGPNKRTFDLLREKASSAEEIRFVVTELYMAGLRRDWSMYDALVYAYTLDDRPDDAFRFLEKITSQEPKVEAEAAVGQHVDKDKDKDNRHWLRQRTLFALLECCFRHADERAWWLIDEAKSRGIEVSRERILEWVDLARRMEEERKEKLQQLQLLGQNDGDDDGLGQEPESEPGQGEKIIA